MANDFELLSISFTAFQTVGLGLSILYGNKFSLHDKIVYPLVCYSVLFALTTALVLVKILMDIFYSGSHLYPVLLMV